MVRHAIINTDINRVVNVVEYDTDISGQVPPGLAAPLLAVASGVAQIGWVWDGSALIDPTPAPDPTALHNGGILSQITELEGDITNRMWREVATASTAVMSFGDGDPRTGKTATQYIAWVDQRIAALRGQLVISP